MKNLITSTLLAALAFASATQEIRAADLTDETEAPLKPRPVDVVQKEITRQNKSRTARALKKSYDAIQAKKYPEALRLATSAQKDELFFDYANWLSASAQMGIAQKALASKKYPEAVRAAESAVSLQLKIEAKNPYSPMLKNMPREVGLSEVLIGDAQAGAKKWTSAEHAFERGFQRLSTSGALGLVRPESLTDYARACSEDEGDLCQAWIQRFASYYPKNSGEMRAVLKVFPAALERSRSYSGGKLTQAYKAPDLDQVAFEQCLALYLDGKFGNAIKGFRQFGDEFPKSTYRFRARYWLAQALTQEQDHDKAKQAYQALQHDSPLTYYGLLSALASGASMDATITQTVPLAIERDPLLQPHELLRLRRAEHFLAEGAPPLAALELKEFKSRDQLSSPFLMYLAALNFEAHTYSTAFTIMSELVGRGYDGATSAAFLRMIFPLEQMDTIQKYATQYGLDPILVLSLIKQESAFDVGAISSSGALGLMQLMPATASDTDPDVERASLIEAESNVRVGAKYLKHLMNRFKGNIVLSLAGYNAGPNAVDRWVKESGGKRGMLEFIETIPYKETREYVGSIVRNYYWYAHALKPLEPVKALTYFWGVQGPAPAPSAAASELPQPQASPLAEPSASPAPNASAPET